MSKFINLISKFISVKKPILDKETISTIQTKLSLLILLIFVSFPNLALASLVTSATKLTKDIYSSTISSNIADFFKENTKAYNTLQGVRELIDSRDAVRKYLSSSDTSLEDKELFTKIITSSVMSNLGYIPNNTKLIYTDEKGYDNKDIKGYYSTTNDISYINLKNIFSTKDSIQTIVHEASRAMDAKSNIDITTNRDDNTKYVSNFASYTTRYFADALSRYNKEFTTLSPTSSSTTYTTSPYLKTNNDEFARLNKQMGDNRDLSYLEKDFILAKANQYAKEKGISTNQSNHTHRPWRKKSIFYTQKLKLIKFK